MDGKKMTLMGIETDALALEQIIYESGGELCEALETWMAEIEKNLTVKADGYAAVMDRFESSAALMKAKAAQYTQAARSLENARDRLKERIKGAMILMNKPEIIGDDVRFKLTNGAPKLVINEADLDRGYLLTVTTTVPDKDRIKNDLKSGKEIKGAAFEPVVALRKFVNKKE